MKKYFHPKKTLEHIFALKIELNNYSVQ